MKLIKEILWRNFNEATKKVLEGTYTGQYDIRLGASNDIKNFLRGFEVFDHTDKGGYSVSVPLEDYIDESDESKNVVNQSITIRYMGDESSRKDWNIPRQKLDNAYTLWRLGRKLQPSSSEKSVICLIKDIDNRIYARVLLEDEIAALPEFLKTEINSNNVGIFSLNTENYFSEAEKIYTRLIDKHNVLLYGPPGTGKTTLMQEVARIFKNGGIYKLFLLENKESNFILEEVNTHEKDNNKVIWTTFHQSYSYEEFILGLTTNNSTDKLLDLQPKPGILLELSEFARGSNNSSLLLIDELNRGNVSRIFGEFITLIEPDKREDINGNKTESTIEVRLPHVKYGETINFKTEEYELSFTNPFTMPYHVYTLASMNSIDNSIHPLDSALQRRFDKYTLMPNLELLAKRMKIDSNNIFIPNINNDISILSVNDIKKIAWKLLSYLNHKIAIFLGKDYSFGHSYLWSLTNEFSNTNDALDELLDIIMQNILPKIEDIFRGRVDLYENIFKIDTISNNILFDIVEPSDEEYNLGATKSFNINYNILELKKEEVILYLQELIEIKAIDIVINAIEEVVEKNDESD